MTNPTHTDRAALIADLRRRYLDGTLDEVLEITDVGMAKLVGDLRAAAKQERRDRRAA